MIELEVTAEVFQAEDGDGWHFAELPEDLTDVVDKWTGGPSGGWASVKCEASVGRTTWRTSLFLSNVGTYLLPLKQDVRRAESIADGDEIDLRIHF
jgi:hypothetical protein